MSQLTRRLWDFLGSRIQFKIILPFAVLTLMVAVVGTYLSTTLVSDSLEERFDRQLADSAVGVTDALFQREQFHLAELRTMAFTEGIDQAIASNDFDQLQAILFPIIFNDELDRVDVVGLNGKQLISIRRPPGATSREAYEVSQGADMTDWPTVGKVLNSVVDNEGDKHIALTPVPDGDRLFITAGPVKQDNEVIAAILVSSHVSTLMRSLSQATFADVTLYTLTGEVIGTTLPRTETLYEDLHIGNREVTRLLDETDPTVYRITIEVQSREYALLHEVYSARGSPLILFSVALQTQFIEARGTAARNQMIVIFLTALFFVFGIGLVMSNMITNRVQYLMENAMAVASGDFSRRTQIGSRDEIGMLARSLDNMTVSLAQYTDDLQRKIDELTALYESSTAVTVRSGLNLDHVLRAVTSSIQEVMRNIDHVVIHLMDEEGEVLTPIISTPPDAAVYPPLVINARGKIREILDSAEPQVIALSEIENYSPQGAFRMQGHSEALVAPLVTGQETIGMVTLTLKSNGVSPLTNLSPDNLRLLGTFTNQAAIAIKNAQLFEETEQAYQELQQLDDLKTEFINIAAHELRTPLGAIMGHASFVEKRAPEKLQKYMNFIVISALRMRTMVDAMLTIQRLDAGTAFLKLMSINIRTTLTKIVADYRPMAELEGHTLSLDAPEDLPPVEIDPEKIGLVFSNLVSNAIKFTPEGGRIDIEARDYGNFVLVTVADNGIGIPPESQTHIFERFYQVPVGQDAEGRANLGIGAGQGGIGIGLTIVKHLLELHGGDIWVESEVNQGATFFVTLPKYEQPQETEREMAVPTLK